jgi:hypothetical protein
MRRGMMTLCPRLETKNPERQRDGHMQQEPAILGAWLVAKTGLAARFNGPKVNVVKVSRKEANSSKTGSSELQGGDATRFESLKWRLLTRMRSKRR